MLRAFIAVFTVLLMLLIPAPPAMAAGLSAHSLAQFGKALVNYKTYVAVAEGAVDGVHAATFAVSKATATVDKAVAKTDTFLESIK
jgi:hypothetical protein